MSVPRPYPPTRGRCWYNEADGKFYLKDFFLDWFEVNPITGALTPLLTDIFTDNQSSPTLVSGGTQILEQYSGTVRILDLATGVEQSTMSGFTVGSGLLGGEQAIATDGLYLFTIDLPTVYMYDMQGRPVMSFDVLNSAIGVSLSYANDMLWVSPDWQTGT
jgi:hypothetical protein